VAQIREMGRSTQGVTLIALGEGEKLAGMERIEERDVNGNGNGQGHGPEGGNGGAGPDGDIEPEPPTGPAPTVH
jgi:DNA gyrase subunit A